MNAVGEGRISARQARIAIAVHTVGSMVTAGASTLGSWVGTIVVGGETAGVGAVYGYVAGGLIFGSATSWLVDRGEKYIYRKMGIQ